MSKGKVFILTLMVGLIAFAVFGYKSAADISYESYVSGDYFFRYRATTFNDDNGVVLTYIDMTKTRNILWFSNNLEVLVSDPHDGVCTVFYNNEVIEDYPIGKLHINHEDADYFYGRKTYTESQYLDKLNSLTSQDINNGAINNANAIRSIPNLTYTIVFVSLGILLFIAYIILKDNTIAATVIVLLFIANYVFWTGINATSLIGIIENGN